MSVRLVKGNILDDPAGLLVNPVNLDGVMGAGLALAFKNHFGKPLLTAYKQQLYMNRLRIGRPAIWTNPDGPNVMNFATKNHWREPSKREWIESGLQDVAKHLKASSMAMPLLGCGLGGLRADDVIELIVRYLDPIDCDVSLYVAKGEAQA